MVIICSKWQLLPRVIYSMSWSVMLCLLTRVEFSSIDWLTCRMILAWSVRCGGDEERRKRERRRVEERNIDRSWLTTTDDDVWVTLGKSRDAGDYVRVTVGEWCRGMALRAREIKWEERGREVYGQKEREN